MTPDLPGTHAALIYRGADEFVDAVSGYVRDGLAHRERVMVMAGPEKLAMLVACLGDDADRLELVDSRDRYRPQARATRATLDFVGRGGQRRSRVVAEQAAPWRSRIEIADYRRIEAAANVVYRPYPVSVVCPYDASALPEDILVSCGQTHANLVRNCHLEPSVEFVDPARFVADSTVGTEPPATAASFSCDTVADLASARRFVHDRATRAGLDQVAALDLVQAVSEVLANALSHGRPPRRLYVYTDGPALVCHVHDSGFGPDDPLAGYAPPPDPVSHGQGLWLARQLCDSVEVGTAVTGTHVRLFSLLQGRRV